MNIQMLYSQTNFTGYNLKIRYLMTKRIFVNAKTQVYEVIDLDNIDLKLVVKLKNRNFDRARMEC